MLPISSSNSYKHEAIFPWDPLSPAACLLVYILWFSESGLFFFSDSFIWIILRGFRRQNHISHPSESAEPHASEVGVNKTDTTSTPGIKTGPASLYFVWIINDQILPLHLHQVFLNVLMSLVEIRSLSSRAKTCAWVIWDGSKSAPDSGLFQTLSTT